MNSVFLESLHNQENFSSQMIVFQRVKLGFTRFLWQENDDKLRQGVVNQRHYSANKGPYSQGYGLSSSHVQLWELDCKEGRVPKKLKLLKCGAGEGSWKSLGEQGIQTNQS